MPKLLIVAFFLLFASSAQAQFNPGGGGGGGGNISNSGTPAALQSPQWVDATHIKGVSQGVFNVRTMYGAVPDGSTDNSTAITNAFTASNAFTNTPNNGAGGVPIIYFDCDTGTTTCEYNYGGSGTSPINPNVPTTILCAPGATLNYTGSAHAADIGPTGLSQQATIGSYKINSCQWTGGATYTAGIYVHDYLENITIENNNFINFGSVTAYSIVIPGNNFRVIIQDNRWIDNDGTARSMVDTHLSVNPDMLFSRNKTSCLNSATHASCLVSAGNIGVGVWTNSAVLISGNELAFHQPAIRVSALQGQLARIVDNWFESNTSTLGPAITYGDPGGTAATVQINLFNNSFFWPMVANQPIIGPETPASGSYTLAESSFAGNLIGPAPSGTTYIVAGNVNNYVGNNLGPTAASVLTRISSPAIIDSGFATTNAMFALMAKGAVNQFNANSLPQFDSNGLNIAGSANYSAIAGPLLCTYSAGSGTAATCSPTPGLFTTPPTGSILIFESTTTANTGAYTLVTNGGTAFPVRKNNGTTALVAGDIAVGKFYTIIFDGTQWQLQTPSNVTQSLSGTTASIGGGALTAACVSGSVSITGVTSSMAVAVSPAADITSGGATAFSVFGVPSAGSVAVNVCGTGTPTATTYNVRAIE